jgi:hypothetical protein
MPVVSLPNGRARSKTKLAISYHRTVVFLSRKCRFSITALPIFYHRLFFFYHEA